MLEIIVRIVVAGCLMVGSAHLPWNSLQAASAAPAEAAPVHLGPRIGPAM